MTKNFSDCYTLQEEADWGPAWYPAGMNGYPDMDMYPRMSTMYIKVSITKNVSVHSQWLIVLLTGRKSTPPIPLPFRNRWNPMFKINDCVILLPG